MQAEARTQAFQVLQKLGDVQLGYDGELGAIVVSLRERRQ